MSKRKIPKGQINKRNSQTIKALLNLMKDIDQGYSIKVGILGASAQRKQEGSDLTNAELGAIHEFGCTINVTEKMRHFFYKKWGIQKSNKPIVIPERSFLRATLLDGRFEEYVKENCLLFEGKDFEKVELDGSVPLHTEKYRRKYQRMLGEREAREQTLDIAKMRSEENPKYVEGIANWIASEAWFWVRMAFENGGYGKWKPITQFTKENRQNDQDSPPLTDSGELKNSIISEVKRIK